MTRTIRVIGLAALAAALTALTPGVAGAKVKKKKIHGQITIAYEKNPTGTDRFSGAVTSPNSRCNRGATVQLGFRPAFEGSPGSNYPRTIVGSTKSDTAGGWEIFYEVAPNGVSPFSSYSATAPKRRLSTKRPGLKLICKYASSSVITLASG
jgi:hypothetical protein